MPVSLKNSRLILFVRYWLPVIIYAGLIFYISSLPGEELPALFLGQDAVFHLIEYAGLALLISRAIKKYYPQHSQIKRIIWVLVSAVIFASADEFHQSFVPGRMACGLDVAIDTLGSLAGNLISR